MRRRAFLVGLVALVASCGHKSSPKTHQVEIKGMLFVPAQLDVSVGDTIVWTNADVLPHTVTSGEPSAKTFDSKSIDSKQQWTYEVTAAGEYAYVCSFHPTMHGTFTAH